MMQNLNPLICVAYKNNSSFLQILYSTEIVNNLPIQIFKKNITPYEEFQKINDFRLMINGLENFELKKTATKIIKKLTCLEKVN